MAQAGIASGTETEIRAGYAAIRNAYPQLGHVSVLHLGKESTTLAVGQNAEPESILELKIGSHKTAREYFKHTPPTPHELETAIQNVEGEVTRARGWIPIGTPLYATGAAVRMVAKLSGADESPEMVLSLDAVERTFDRMASVALGIPASRQGLAESIEFAATLLILREFMHHMQIASIVFA